MRLRFTWIHQREAFVQETTKNLEVGSVLKMRPIPVLQVSESPLSDETFFRMPGSAHVVGHRAFMVKRVVDVPFDQVMIEIIEDDEDEEADNGT